MDIKKLAVLCALVAVAAVLVSFTLLLSIDMIVRQSLYKFGLQFSYEWANPYWIYLRASLALLMVAVIAVVYLTVTVLRQDLMQTTAPDGRMHVEAELNRLREKLWKARGRQSRLAGVAYLILSGIFLFLAYFTRYLAFEVISILALLLGVVFVFSGMESYVKTDVANKAVTSLLVPLVSFLSSLKSEGRAIHVPPTNQHQAGRIFLSKKDQVTLPTFEEITRESSIVVLDDGFLLPAVGNSLLQVYENELGNLRNFDLEYLMTWLPRILVDTLQIAKKAEISRKNDDVTVKITGLVFRNVCQHPAGKVVCKVTGCPMCSSVAEAVSKNTNRIVYYLGCENDLAKLETMAFYRLGPTVEELRREKK